MSLFVISALAKQEKENEDCPCPTKEKLITAIEKNIAESDRLQINPCTWVVSFKGTANQLSDKVGITKGESGLALITSVQGTAGYGPRTVGEWLNAHSGD